MSAVERQSGLEVLRRAQRAGAHLARRRERQLRHHGRAPAAAARPPSCACCWASRAPTRGRITVDGAPLRPEPGPRPRHRVPALLGVPAPDRAGQRRARARVRAQPGARAGCTAPARRAANDEAAAMLADVGLGHACRCLADRALGRHAAAARDRPGADPQAEDPAARRAVRRARPRHPQRHARADHPALARDRDDRVHGHPRHRRGVQARHAHPDLRPGAPRPAGARCVRRLDHL